MIYIYIYIKIFFFSCSLGLKATLNKLNVRDIPAIEEVNLFKDDGMVIHFANPKGNISYIYIYIYTSMIRISNIKQPKYKKGRR